MTTAPARGEPGPAEADPVEAIRAGTPEDDLTPVVTPARVVSAVGSRRQIGRAHV